MCIVTTTSFKPGASWGERGMMSGTGWKIAQNDAGNTNFGIIFAGVLIKTAFLFGEINYYF